MSILIRTIGGVSGVVLLACACGRQEHPRAEQPSGYQAPTADAGTDEGIGNMGSDPGDDDEVSDVAPMGLDTTDPPQSTGGYEGGTMTGTTSRATSSTVTGAGGGPAVKLSTRSATAGTTGMGTSTGTSGAL